MADTPEDDVLELEEEHLVDQDEDDPEGPAEDDDEQPFIGFEGDEAAPASEGETSTIREMRRELREKAKRIAELERSNAPAKVEVGEKPTLESCEYDEERFEAGLTQWHQRKAQADAQEREQHQAAEKSKEHWAHRQVAYESNKASLGVSDYDDVEGEVTAVLPPETVALLMLTEKPAGLVYALGRNPGKLAELSKLDPARAAMMIGKLEDKLTMGKRKLPDPDRPVTGTAAPGSADKELARLEKEAERTGDLTKLINYERQLKDRARK